MTEYKEHNDGLKHPSLYIGLLYNMLGGLILSVAAWIVIMLLSYYLIGAYYVTPKMKNDRCDKYIENLQTYVTSNGIDENSTGKISEWVRDNPYVFLLIDNNGDKANIVELVGSKVDETLPREELISAAIGGGYHSIRLSSDGSINVAIAEYTENLYYSTVNLISILAAGLTFVLLLVRYIRIIIERIKRFESDVTIVSEIDMDYEIVSEGADEIANLEGKVEHMRQSMLHHIKSEQEARETNAELIASISHDIRTPLTVLMGYIEMMKEHGGYDETMESYVLATESTALRLKQLSDNMFRYSLAFGDTAKSVKLEEYDALTLLEQRFSEHYLLMREMGYDIRVENQGRLTSGSIIRTDAPNLMRIVDNIFSNLRKYADITKPIIFKVDVFDSRLVLECKNIIRTDNEGAESNGIGLKTCSRLASLVAEKFEYFREGDSFVCRLVIALSDSGSDGRTE